VIEITERSGKFRRLHTGRSAIPSDAFILVDYAGLTCALPNLQKNIVIRSFITSRQLWAWGKWRVKKVRRYVDRMFVTCPLKLIFTAIMDRCGILWQSGCDSVVSGMQDRKISAHYPPESLSENQ